MSRLTATGLMILTAMIWGTTFVAQQLGMNHVGPLTYTAIRFLIGAGVVVPVAWLEYRSLSAQGFTLTRSDGFKWIGLGALLFGGVIFQQVGMAYTTVTKAAFLTALYVPLVPLLVWLFERKRPAWMVWPISGCSVLGTLMLTGGRMESIATGDAWVIASVLFWALHVYVVGRVTRNSQASTLNALTQFICCGLMGSALAILIEPIELDGIRSAMYPVLYGGLLSVGVAYTLQVVAQKYVRSSDAAIIMSSETLFAAIAGSLWLGETLSVLQMGGCALILLSIMSVQLIPST